MTHKNEPIQTEEPIHKSRSQKKREAKELIVLARVLIDLRDQDIDRLPLGDKICCALKDGKGIKSHGAKKRHVQYIGKLLREQEFDATKLRQSLPQGLRPFVP